jgi:predicted RNase H-like HicB family nuclease
MRFKAIVHEAEEGGFWASVPALPGCITEADTHTELIANLKEAISLWMEVANERDDSEPGGKALELSL